MKLNDQLIDSAIELFWYYETMKIGEMSLPEIRHLVIDPKIKSGLLAVAEFGDNSDEVIAWLIARSQT